MVFCSGVQRIVFYAMRKALGNQNVSGSPRAYYFSKELVDSLNTLARHAGCSTNQVATELLTRALTHRKAAETNLQRWQTLSQREQQVTALVCLNLTNQEIAAQLGISPETVKSHLQNIFNKFGFHHRSDLRLALADWDFSNWG